MNGSERAHLVARDNGTANLARADLGHVQNDDGGDEADAKACEEASDNDGGQSARREHPAGGNGRSAASHASVEHVETTH